MSDLKPKDQGRDENIAGKGFQTLNLDVEYYQSFLDDTDVPEEKRQELIETLWSIIVGFVDLGFGVHPVQQAGNEGQGQTAQALAEFIADAGDDEPEDQIQTITGVETPERIDG